MRRAVARAMPAPRAAGRRFASALPSDACEVVALVEGAHETADDIAQRFRDRARDVQPHLNAFVELAEEEHPGHGAGGLLDGVALGVKASFCVEGTISDAASVVLDRYKAPYTATTPGRLLGAGCRLVGKNNQDELAMGTANLFSAWGPALNPHSPGLADGAGSLLSPGGSSGGGAASVAAGACLLSLGSDTGGSVRLPAAFCGVLGLKPSYGRLSRFGLIAFASSLDTPGILARCAADAALALDAASGSDPRDDTSVRSPRPGLPSRADVARAVEAASGGAPVEAAAAAGGDAAFSGALVHGRRPTAAGRRGDGDEGPGSALPEGLASAVRGRRVGVLAECHVAELPPAVLELWREGARWLADAGAEVVPVSVPELRSALAAYYILAPAEAASNLSRFDGVRYGLRKDGDGGEGAQDEVAGRSTGGLERMYTATRTAGFGPEVQRRILTGNLVLSSGGKGEFYDAAVAARRHLRARMDRLFESGEVDFMLTPTAPGLPTDVTSVVRDGADPTDDPVTHYLGDVMTVGANLADLPAVSVPVGAAPLPCGGRAPVALQLLAGRFRERELLHAAAVLEWFAPHAAVSQWPWDARA